MGRYAVSLGPVGRFFRRAIDGPFGMLHRTTSLDHNVLAVLERRAVEQSADYIESAMPKALGLRSREELWQLACREASAGGLFLEFGVFSGYSVNFIAKQISSTVYGFDSFQGLREDWAGGELVRGSYDLGGRLPKVRRNVVLIKGWFQDTLPAFLREHRGGISFMHLDCDTYEATKFVLGACNAGLTDGSIIVFDDYHGARGFKEGQFKAWKEFISENNSIRYTYLAFNRRAVLVKVQRDP
jgi:predicted O-methyltransferase YrrM